MYRIRKQKRLNGLDCNQNTADDSNNYIFPFKFKRKLQFFSLHSFTNSNEMRLNTKTGRELDQTHKNDSRLISIFKTKNTENIQRKNVISCVYYTQSRIKTCCICPTHHDKHENILFESLYSVLVGWFIPFEWLLPSTTKAMKMAMMTIRFSVLLFLFILSFD